MKLCFSQLMQTKMTIAVIGENATRSMTVGGGSSELKAKLKYPLEGLKIDIKMQVLFLQWATLRDHQPMTKLFHRH
jgi:hypothetical protein